MRKTENAGERQRYSLEEGWKGCLERAIESECEKYMHCMRTLETAREIGGESAHERQRKIIFPREGRLWNFCGTHRIHKRFLTKSTGSTWVGQEQRDNMEMVHTHLF